MSVKTNNEKFNVEALIENGEVTFDDISRSLSTSGEYMPDLYARYYPKVVKPERRLKYDTNYVFDENKSVKWNREEVVRQNKLIEASVRQYHKDLNSGRTNLISDLKTVINHYLGNNVLNDAQTSYIIDYANAVADSMYELVEKVSSVTDFVYDLNRLAK